MKRVHWLCGLVWCLVCSASLVADEAIEVTSQGAVEVVPDMIWIEGSLSGSGDVTEAKKILSGLKDDIRQVLEDATFANVKLEYTNRSVTSGANSAMDMQRQMMQMMGEGGAPAETEGMFTLAEDFRLVLSGLTEANFLAESERMLQLAEALSDKQIKLGRPTNPMMPYYNGQNMGQFMRVGLSDPDRVWKTASQAAFENARAKAAALAEISGGKLGSAISLSVDSNDAGAEDVQSGVQELIVARFSGISSSARSGVSQTSLDRIPVKVTLRVRFAFVPGN
ncbi:MAG: SIMPL domain-containing protein [Pirellulaceae bacterium]|nr:SIMPL domain-containing protein [Pirellulaceae bacterium]